MNHLLRESAPLSELAWSAIDTQATQRLRPALAARRLVDFSGPHGWDHSAVNLGRAVDVETAAEGGLSARRRRVLPLVELRVVFELRRSEMQDIDRGARDPDLGALDAAAKRIAAAENRAVFHGFAGGDITGIAAASSHQPIDTGGGFDQYPRSVARGVERLMEAGIGGPFGLALGPEVWTGVVETTEHGGYPVLDHLRHILDGPLIWAPGVEGAVLLSLRGGDFVLECGQDLSVGYESHTAEVVRLYLEESFTFRVDEPDAAVVLRAK